MSDLSITVTSAGRAALVNASHTGTAPATITHFGVSAIAVTPGADATTLPGEIKRLATLSGDVVAADTIHLVVRDESSDVFTMRSFALYLADGTLFAIYGQPAVILEKSAQALMLLQVDVQFPDVQAELLTFGDLTFLNPPATTERQGVVELATVAEAQAGIDALRALTPASARAAMLGWLLAQDGAGSGIDSDLLDGQQGAWYADIAGRLGYTPLNRGGDTMTGLLGLSGVPTGNQHAANKQYVDGLVTAAALLAKLITVDGAGSGIDSDLLDGQHGAWYADIAGRLGFNPLNAAAYTALDVRAKLHTVDGAGSGIDADLLDGFDSSAFGRLVWHNSSREAGGRMWADGFKECWGTNSFAGDQTKTINYPFSFTAWSLAFLEGGFNSNGQQENGPFVMSAALTGFTGMNAINANVSVFWHAFGY